MQNLRYPLGQQNFRNIREEGGVYVDKTGFIPRLLENKYYFLSRPRRFGKSLFLSTLESFFKGERELFKSLEVDSFDWDWNPHPVIRMDFTGENYTVEGNLEKKIFRILKDYADSLNVEIEDETPSGLLENIIKKAAKTSGRGVVILVDEYEKPILDNLSYPEVKEKNKQILSGLFSVLKEQDENIRFAFLTGITRFGHINIFSGLNNIKDISLSPQYTDICGITDEEINKFLLPGVQQFAEHNKQTVDEALHALKEFYDGYHFSEQLTDVYNPYSLLNGLSDKTLVSEWFNSGSPTYLIRQLQKQNLDLSSLEGIEVSRSALLGVDEDMMEPTTLLYQSGYLTIKAYNSRFQLYTLGFPNREVKNALLSAIIPYYLGKQESDLRRGLPVLINDIENGNAAGIMEWLKGFFNNIPPETKFLTGDAFKFERDFQFMIAGIFSIIMDFSSVQLERSTSFGRSDLILITDTYIYVFEFKIGKSSMDAINQIKDKRYALSWENGKRKVIKIGVSFSPEIRGIADYVIS